MKKVICYIFAFFLSLFMFALVLLCVVRFSVFGESNFLRQLNQHDYYESSVIQYNRILSQNARPTNFPVELFDNYVKTVDVIDDMENSIVSVFRGEEYEIDKASFKTKLETTITTYITENNIGINAKTQEAINMFVNTNVENYGKLFQFPFFEYIDGVIPLVHKVFLIMAPILLLLCVVLIGVQMRLHRSVRRKRRWLSYSFVGSGLLLATCPAMLIGYRVFERIHIEPEYLYLMLRSIMNNTCIILVICGIISIVIGMLLAYLKSFVKIKNNKKNKKERDYSHSVKFHAIEKE